MSQISTTPTSETPCPTVPPSDPAAPPASSGTAVASAAPAPIDAALSVDPFGLLTPTQIGALLNPQPSSAPAPIDPATAESAGGAASAGEFGGTSNTAGPSSPPQSLNDSPPPPANPPPGNPPPPPIDPPPLGAMIGDRVWLDADGDGVQGMGESGVAGVTVKLLDGTDPTIVLGTTPTDANGLYHFTVQPGTYAVEFVAPAGTQFSPKAQGNNPTTDSDADVVTGRTDAFVVGSMGTLEIDAGVTSPTPATPTVSVTASDSEASEEMPDGGEFTFARTGDVSAPLSVLVAFGGSATFDEDYSLTGVDGPTQITFAAGESERIVSVLPNEDTMFEPDETVTVSLLGGMPGGYDLGNPTSGTVVIHDASAPFVTVAVSDPWASPSPGDTASFILSRSGDVSLPLSVNYAIAGDTVAGADYQSLTGNVLIPAGAASAPVVVTALPGAAADGPVTVAIGVAPGANYSFDDQNFGRVAIFNAPVVPAFSFGSPHASETENAGFALVSVYLDYGPASQVVAVDYTTSDGTALDATDYQAVAGTLTFQPGETVKVVSVPLIDNTLSEGDRAFNLILSNPTNAVLGDFPASDVTILDDDLATVNVSASDPTASEAGGPGEFTITRSGNLDVDLTVYYAVGGTATESVDFVEMGSSVLLPAGVAFATLALTPVDDALCDEAETVVVQLSTDHNYLLGTSTQATATIADDATDVVPVVSVEATVPVAVKDDGTPAAFAISRTGPLDADLVVPYSLAGEAVADEDYVALSGVVTVPAGQSSVVIPVVPLPSQPPGGVEGLVLTLQPGSLYGLEAVPFDAVSLIENTDTPKPAVKEVRPLDKDFTPRETGASVGRIIGSAVKGGGFSTVKKTTAKNTVAQTQAGKVKITAYLDKLVKDVVVYFEVIDPRENARYSNKTKAWDSKDMDEKPATLWDKDKPKHNIEAPDDYKTFNDNRDPMQNMQGGEVVDYNKFQKASLSATSATSQIVEIDDGNGIKVKQAVAEVELTVSARFSGDNYVVRATTVNPGAQGANKPNKPFNTDSKAGPEDDTAKIAKADVKQSALLTAWKRIYYEYDPSFRVGAELTKKTNVGDDEVTVLDATKFKVGDKVQVLDSANREPELRVIKKITGAVLTLDKTLTKAYKPWTRDNNTNGFGYVGRLNAANAKDLYLPDVSKLSDTYDDVFVEIAQTTGSAPVPWQSGSVTSREVFGFMGLFFDHEDKERRPDVFQLVGAPLNELGAKQGAGASGLTNPPNNQTVVFFINPISREELKPPRLRDTVNHEVCHQFDPPGVPDDGHNDLMAHDGSDKCLMTQGDLTSGKGRRNDSDDLMELSLDQIYKIRDKDDAI